MHRIAVFWVLVMPLFLASQSRPNVLKTVPSGNGKPSHFAYAPSMKPVFREPGDSTQYEQLQAWMAMANPPIGRDSIWMLQVSLLNNRVSRYRPVYRGERDFKNLAELKTDELYNAKYISIQNASRIDKRLLDCKKVLAVELVNTSVQKIPRWLKRLDSLKSIRVINNQSSKPLKLGRNKRIQTLVIRGNHPQLLPKRYTSLRKLKTLDLSGTGLKEIPQNAFHCKKLKSFTLKGNFISLDQYNFPANKQLDKLDLSANMIKHIPASIGNLTSLTKLLLAYNDVETIDNKLGDLAQLSQLSLYSNNMKIFPEALYGLKNLRELDLYFNEFERLDERIQNWQELEILYLANNKLLSVPTSIGSLSKLTELYLHNNRLSSLPESLAKLPKLRVLRVNKNGLMALPDSLRQIETLENLDISQNLLSYLPDGFWGYPRLRILAMAANPWDKSLVTQINQMAEELRKKNTVVHLDEVNDDN